MITIGIETYRTPLPGIVDTRLVSQDLSGVTVITNNFVERHTIPEGSKKIASGRRPWDQMAIILFQHPEGVSDN
jgi:hypothetical protein